MTAKAVKYRPGSKWHIMASLTAAIAIHLSAVALASLRHEMPVSPAIGFTEVDVQGLENPQPPTQPDEVQPSPTLPPDIGPPADFVDDQPPPRQVQKRLPVVPIGLPRQTRLAVAGNPKTLAVSAPRPEYPYEARSRHITGSGVAMLTVDPASGSVLGATMEQGIGSSILDNSAISAFKRWRFKPGTISKIRIPVTFTITGAQY